MTPELASAIAAFLIAITAIIRDELARRRLDRRLEHHGKRLVDVQAKVGADRRPWDHEV